jgi:CIC family chloride channel protein
LTRAREERRAALGAQLRWLARTRHPVARWGRTLALAVLVGWLAGLAALALASGLHVGAGLLVGRFAAPAGVELGRFELAILLLPAAGGLFSGLVVRWLARGARGAGTDQMVDAFHHRDGRLALRVPAVKAAAAVGVISSGGSAGPEGPIAGLGAAIGSSAGRLVGLAPREVRVLLVSGCAAGVGAVFGCPLGGALFAASVLYRQPEFEGSALVSAFVASAVGYSTFDAFAGNHGRVLSHAESLAFGGAAQIPVYVLLGLACGATAIFLWLCLTRVERAVARFRLPGWLEPAFGGLLTGAIACLVPQVMDGEHRFVNAIFSGALASDAAQAEWTRLAAFLALVVAAKCVATGTTVGSGAAGGVLGPSVAIGGMVGATLAALLASLAPELVDAPLRRALVPVGMAGVLAAAMRTPIAAMAMAMEMTGGFGLIVPLMLVTMTAYVVGRRFGLIDAQTPSSAESPAHAGDAVVALLERFRVADVMDTAWPQRALPSTPLAALVESLRPDVAPVVPVISGERLVGTVSMAELRHVLDESELPRVLIAADLLSEAYAAVEPRDTLYDAVSLFQELAVDALPVVEDRRGARYLGVVARSHAYEAVRDHLERLREGLLQEHAGLAVLEHESELAGLLGGMSSLETGRLERVRVGSDLAGRSLREIDFRRHRGGAVLAIRTREGGLLCPPDPERALRVGDALVVLRSGARAAAESGARAPAPETS